MDGKVQTETNKQLSILNPQALAIVENVIKKCKKEIANDGITNAHIVKAYFYTGVPHALLEQIDKEIESENSLNDPENSLYLHLKIRELIKDCYAKGIVPTCNKNFYNKFQNDFNNITYKQFLNLLVTLGYRNIKVNNETIMVMEDPKITFQRYHYLKGIINARNVDRKIYYLSIKVFDEDTKSMVPFTLKCKNKLSSESDILILYHVVSRDGYENGFFSYSYEPENLSKWLLLIVKPLLQPSSLIVVENNLMYETPREKYISKYHPKKDMINYLRTHNIPCSTQMDKAELFDLIEKCSIKQESNSLDNILMALGHEVLHLSEHLQQFSIGELLWQNVNRSLSDIPIVKPMSIAVKGHISNTLTLINTALWSKYDEAIRLKEKQFMEVDSAIESMLENYDLDYDNIVPECEKKWYHINFCNFQS